MESMIPLIRELEIVNGASTGTGRPPSEPAGLSKPCPAGPEEYEVSPEGVSDSDEQLLRRLATHDTQALQSLMDRHGLWMKRLIQRFCAWSDDCDDLCQETWLRVWDKASTWKNGHVKSWLARIAVNRCRNHFRSRAIWNRFLEQLRIRSSRRAEAPRADRNAGIDMRDLTRVALARLNHASREMLVLHYLEEMTTAEIAELTGQKTGTVLVKLHRARAKMRKVLEELDGHER